MMAIATSVVWGAGSAVVGAGGVLAQVPALGEHFSLVKLGGMTAAFIAWLFVCQWVDRDTDVVKTNREQWNLIVLSGGIAGILVWLMLPWKGSLFFLGLAFWLVLASGSALAYVVHRNGRVVAKARVMTPGHFRRLIGGGGRGKKERVDKGQRVRIQDAVGKPAAVPEEPEEYEQYTAVQEFLFDLLWRRASEADMTLGKDDVRLRYRIDGVVLEQPHRLGHDEGERVVTYLKKLAGLNPEERRRPQTGKCNAGLLASTGDGETLEVNTSGSTSGEKLHLRVKGVQSVKRLPMLGLRDADRQRLEVWLNKPRGLVLISGTKGSGVTTTQYAIMRDHDAFMQNLHTLEMSPLLDLDNITQNRHTGDAKDVSYARQLQSVLRREPDVVLVGDCPDRETAQIACRAAAGERKVYLALEGKDAFEALDKFRQLVDDDKTLSEAMIGFTNQRLVRVLCPTCRQAFKPDKELLKKLNLPWREDIEFSRPPTEPVLDKKGQEILCQTCQGTGFLGRTGVFEVLEVDDEVRKLLAAGTPTKTIKDYYRRIKSLDLMRAGLQKVYEGVTSLEEVVRAIRPEGK